ncbi:hypothetical protein PGTUg99_000011 [Puccinia graminis f. sp. tritici]|uniref:Uncharacterized protein n=1 Tax=Puccinia graminis f. sp. tritici TaxID=56615 RepID=A0A5B0RWY0_PUCGR|nr:hypothetical protein PGTUg99_000011 [Puccinia graminis f. sp. tritici]
MWVSAMVFARHHSDVSHDLLSHPASTNLIPSQKETTSIMTNQHTSLTDLTQLVPSSSSSPNLDTTPKSQQQPSADETVALLKTRFLSDLPYLWLSPRCLISLALNKNSPRG